MDTTLPPISAFSARRPMSSSASTGGYRLRFGADEPPKPAAPEPGDKPAPTGEAKSAEAPKKPGGILSGCVYPLLGFAVIPLIPFGWTVAGVAALTLGFPIAARIVNPKYEDGVLKNKEDVQKNIGKLVNMVTKFGTMPLKIVPNCLNIWGWKDKLAGGVQKAADYLTEKGVGLFETGTMKNFITNIPKSTFGKVAYFAKWIVVLGALALEKKLAKQTGFLASTVGWLLSLGFLSEMKTLAQKMFKEMLPEDLKKHVPDKPPPPKT
jgi:hypothetical protein